MDKRVRFNRNFLFVTPSDDLGSDLRPQVSDNSCPLLLIIQKPRETLGLSKMKVLLLLRVNTSLATHCVTIKGENGL